MAIKFLQLNIERGRFLNKILEFVRKNDFDILNFQEVSGGKISVENRDSFAYLKKNLPNYDARMAITLKLISDKNSYFGNATFFKRSITLTDKHILELNPYSEIEDFTERDVKEDSRNALFLTLKIDGEQIQVINTHLAWGPTSQDEPYKLEQAKRLYKRLKMIKDPFILSGDFNLEKDSWVIKWMETLGRNLTSENNISNTLNPRTHRFHQLFPKGVAVDYVFVSKSIKVNKFRVVDEVDLSDHYGLLAELDF